jgi:hypothetical protein
MVDADKMHLILTFLAFYIAVADVWSAFFEPSDDQRQATPCVYLTGTLGFSEVGRYFVLNVLAPEIARRGYHPLGKRLANYRTC